MWYSGKARCLAPFDDSGYSGSSPLSPRSGLEKRAASEEGESLFKSFEDVLRELDRLELSVDKGRFAEQLRVFDDYLEKNQEEIENKQHFKLLDLSLKDRYPVIKRARQGQEGIAFLAIVGICSNKDLIEKLISLLKKEQGKTEEELLSDYVDIDGYNLLHYLSDIILRKADRSRQIGEEDWEAWEHFAKRYPALAESYNFIEQTPRMMIEEFSPLSPPSINPDLSASEESDGRCCLYFPLY